MNAWPQTEKGRWLGWPSCRLRYFTRVFHSWHFQGESKFGMELKASAKTWRSKRMEQAWKISGRKDDLHTGRASVLFMERSKHRHPDITCGAGGSGHFYFLKGLPVGLLCSQDWDLSEGPFELMAGMTLNAVLRSWNFILHAGGGNNDLKIWLFMLLILPNVWLRAWLISKHLIKVCSLKSWVSHPKPGQLVRG